jgi:hypothetical protein
MPIDIGSRLGRDDMLLQTFLQDFALAERDTQRFEPMVTLLQTQESCGR